MDNSMYISHVVETRRRDDEVAYAERHRLAKGDGVIPPMKLYQRWLVRLGVLLVLMGSRLQNRYQTLVTVSNSGSITESEANPC